jgi:ankyrin repeat protein
MDMCERFLFSWFHRNNFNASELLNDGKSCSDDSSIYHDGFQMKLHYELRMSLCFRHSSTIMMAAVRYDELNLLEWIVKQTKECDDIDFENIYGDTALILACRLGKIRMVESLVQHGAEVNKESKKGKTGMR